MHDFNPFSDSEDKTRSSAHERLFNDVEPINKGSQVPSKISCRSFWKIFDKIGLRQQPCFKPFDAWNIGERWSPMRIVYPVLLYMLLIMLYSFPTIPFFQEFVKHHVSINLIKKF